MRPWPYLKNYFGGACSQIDGQTTEKMKGGFPRMVSAPEASDKEPISRKLSAFSLSFNYREEKDQLHPSF